MGSRHHPRLIEPALLCAAALAVPLAAGCSAKSDASSGEPKAAKPATLQQLAQQTDCRLTGQRKVAAFQQGNCKTSQGRFVLLSFTTEKGMNTWLEEAKPWGGAYLVGVRWIAVSTDKTLESLRKDLGGKIVHGRGHGPGHG